MALGGAAVGTALVATRQRRGREVGGLVRPATPAATTLPVARAGASVAAAVVERGTSKQQQQQQGLDPLEFKRTYDVGVVGGGIVGLATARELKLRFPHLRVVVFEKVCWGRRHYFEEART